MSVVIVLPLKKVTSVGVVRLEVSPRPRCPHQLAPQAQSLPSDVTNAVWWLPAAQSEMVWPSKKVIGVGVLRFTVSPRPSWPS